LLKRQRIILAILGPTASGKTGFAIEVAQAIGGEILCVDSTTVYRNFDIGTSKPTQAQRNEVPHHLLDILSPNEPFNASDFVLKAKAQIEDISARGKVPLLVGGSYFYLRALQNGMYPTGGYDENILEEITEEFSNGEELDFTRLHGELERLDPTSAKSIHPNDQYRLVRAVATARAGRTPSTLQAEGGLGPDWLWVKYAMALSRKWIWNGIATRTQQMLEAGLVEETRKLLESYPKAKLLGSIGYAETVRFLRKEINEGQLQKEITENTRKLLKRQTTWLRSDPELRFIDPRDGARVKLEVSNLQSVLGAN
jgi:tRNA dimethylallyltransferase